MYYQQALKASLERKEASATMCYTRKDRDDLEKEARRVTESRLMEEEARRRHEGHQRRREQEKKPLTEKVKEVVGVR